MVGISRCRPILSVIADGVQCFGLSDLKGTLDDREEAKGFK